LAKKDAFTPLLEPRLASVMPFYVSNTIFTNITKTSKSPINKREKWLVLPTLCAAQSPTVNIKAQNSVFSEQKPHHRAGKKWWWRCKADTKASTQFPLSSRCSLVFEKIISFLLWVT